MVAEQAGSEREDAAPVAKPPARRRFVPTIAVSAFVMSLTVALINAFYAVRGSDVVVLPPDSVLIHRDGEGARAVMVFDLPLSMINAADAARGDVLLEASLTPGAGAPSFRWQSTVKTVFADVADAGTRCPIDRRCVVHPGLVLIDEADTIADLPGGQARARTFSFPAAQWNCRGAAAACARYADFGRALAAVGGRPLEIALTLRFHADGVRRVTCRTAAIDARYLAQVGWATARCEGAKVSGGPWI